jgi:hypothetical protein
LQVAERHARLAVFRAFFDGILQLDQGSLVVALLLVLLASASSDSVVWVLPQADMPATRKAPDRTAAVSLSLAWRGIGYPFGLAGGFRLNGMLTREIF